MSEPLSKSARCKRCAAACVGAAGAILLATCLYLSSVAVLLSLYVHGFRVPSRGFLEAYAVPSNGLVKLPLVGSACSNYFRFCARITGADYEKDNAQKRSTKGWSR